MPRALTTLGLLAALLVAFLAGSCSGEPPVVPADVQKAYELFMEQPSANTYVGFIQTNRKAALDHELLDDAQGVTHQLWALEVQSIHAERNGDLQLAEDVVTRVDELVEGGVIDVYDEVVPGARERLLAARDRVAGMLE